MSAERPAHMRVLIDLNTQCDFLLPGGALPVSNRDSVLPCIRSVMSWARKNQVPIISSLEARRAGESTRGLPPVCIDRTRGQRKVPFTLMPRRLVVQGDNTFDLPGDPFGCYQQIILTKRQPDFLSNPKADRLINLLRPKYWLILGVATTHAVKTITLGLLARSQCVVVVRDGCGHWAASDGDHAIRQMEAKGAVIANSDEIVSDRIDATLDRLIAGKLKSSNSTDESTETTKSPRLRDLRKAKERAMAEKSASPIGSKNPVAKRGRKAKVTDFIPPELIRKRQVGNRSGRGLA